MPVSSVVFDASVVLRAVVDRNEEAASWFERAAAGEVEASWPDLVFVEVANAAATMVREGRIAAAKGAGALAFAFAATVRAESTPELVFPALTLAASRSLSAYDACYVVLAHAADAALVTADRRLAAATQNAILLPS